MLLEKAWAKTHGSYERIEGGDTQLTLRDLTGAPGDTYDFKDEEVDLPKLWEELKHADESNYIICCSIDGLDPVKSKELRAMGLIDKHAYALESVAVLGGEKICELRNPWGEFEWNGDWGDESDKWTDEFKEEVGFSNEDDGKFWMAWEDVNKYFNRVSINKYRDGCELISIRVNNKAEGFTLAKFTISKPE